MLHLQPIDFVDIFLSNLRQLPYMHALHVLLARLRFSLRHRSRLVHHPKRTIETRLHCLLYGHIYGCTPNEITILCQAFTILTVELVGGLLVLELVSGGLTAYLTDLEVLLQVHGRLFVR